MPTSPSRTLRLRLDLSRVIPPKYLLREVELEPVRYPRCSVETMISSNRSGSQPCSTEGRVGIAEDAFDLERGVPAASPQRPVEAPQRRFAPAVWVTDLPGGRNERRGRRLPLAPPRQRQSSAQTNCAAGRHFRAQTATAPIRKTRAMPARIAQAIQVPREKVSPYSASSGGPSREPPSPSRRFSPSSWPSPSKAQRSAIG